MTAKPYSAWRRAEKQIEDERKLNAAIIRVEMGRLRGVCESSSGARKAERRALTNLRRAERRPWERPQLQTAKCLLYAAFQVRNELEHEELRRAGHEVLFKPTRRYSEDF